MKNKQRKSCLAAIEQLRKLIGRPSGEVAAYLAHYTHQSGRLYWYYRLMPHYIGADELDEAFDKEMELGVRAGGGLVLLRNDGPGEDIRHIQINECDRDPEWAEAHPDDFPFALDVETDANFYKLWFDVKLFAAPKEEPLAALPT